MKQKKKSGVQNMVWTLLVLAFIGAALREQLSRPASERTWTGKIARIPYDFRIPTVEKIKTTFWNSNSRQVLVPQVFGIGWTINFYPLLHPETVQRVS